MKKSIALTLGTRVENLGADCSRPDGTSLAPGDIGNVVEIKPPEEGTGLEIDDVADDGRDGYAIVVWPNWGRAIVWPDGEGRRWRRAT